MNKSNLTKKQKVVWEALNTYIAQHDIVPTHAELAELLGCSRPTITIHLRTLEQKGFITRTRNWRDVQLAPQVSEAEETRLDDIVEQVSARLETHGGVENDS
tara:strand:- start:5505 stop:5810 length:306 start_codon:yes stop_codon:yes gene_type:complete